VICPENPSRYFAEYMREKGLKSGDDGGNFVDFSSWINSKHDIFRKSLDKKYNYEAYVDDFIIFLRSEQS
jgi:hypothetical protein